MLPFHCAPVVCVWLNQFWYSTSASLRLSVDGRPVVCWMVLGVLTLTMSPRSKAGARREHERQQDQGDDVDVMAGGQALHA
jgi:hypothetical protein